MGHTTKKRGIFVNFQHLKYFLMVAEELNITRAAERLYISQQSLSNHIGNLERELDVKLFTRSPKLSLTYAGGLLVDTATQILDLHSQYLSKVSDINKQYLGVLRVGISHTCGLALLPDILPKFRAEFPQVDFSLYEGNSNQLEDELSHGRVDLVICFQPINMEGVATVPLTDQQLVMVVPKTFTDRLFGGQAEEVRKQFSQGADIRSFEHLREYTCTGNGTLEGYFEESQRCGVLELPHEVGKEVLQCIAVLVELQEALFMLGGGRNGFQSAFLVRSCDGFEIFALLILYQKDFLVFDFFVHITMFLMTPTAVHGQN